jgi:hypothetical protein
MAVHKLMKTLAQVPQFPGVLIQGRERPWQAFLIPQLKTPLASDEIGYLAPAQS